MYLDGRGVGKNEREAFSWFRKPAEQGYAPAQRDLGEMYLGGRGVEKNEREAVAWFRKAADQGHASAQCKLGYSYAVGRGVQKNEREAAAWFVRLLIRAMPLGNTRWAFVTRSAMALRKRAPVGRMV